VIIIISCFKVSCEELKAPNIKPDSWWYELSNEEQWLYYRESMIQLKAMIELAENNNSKKQDMINLLEENKNFLKHYKPFYPKWGFKISATGIIDKTLSPDVYVSGDALIFILKGRMFFSPGINIKFYDDVGGGINLGIGFVF
jgi:hypothetical protein